jgi:hypothetical protein
MEIVTKSGSSIIRRPALGQAVRTPKNTCVLDLADEIERPKRGEMICLPSFTGVVGEEATEKTTANDDRG